MIFLFDGAMGTQLQQAGLAKGECPEFFALKNPSVVLKIHQKYLQAGSDFIETNTFGASRIKLHEYGLSDQVEAINQNAVDVAKKAIAAEKNFAKKIAGSMGPTGKLIAPIGELSFEDVYENYFEQATILLKSGVNALLLETFIDLQEIRSALLACKDAREKLKISKEECPIFSQMSFGEDGRTVTGTDAQTATIVLDSLGADVIGVNCSLGPENLLPIVKIMASNTNKPISVQPNAGLPKLIDGETIFPMNAKDFAAFAPKLIEAGATFLGGCCGTTPDHIREVKQITQNFSTTMTREKISLGLCVTSRTKTICLSKEKGSIHLIGERINPTGRKKFAQEILSGSLVAVKREVIQQVNHGADILDINMGVASKDPVALMKRTIQEVSQLTKAPLCIDTTDAKVLEEALKVYPGRALVNSVSGEISRQEKFLKIAKRYGAAIICLPVTEKGVAKTSDERIEIIQKILEKAKEFGFEKNDFLLDALVMPCATDKTAGREILSTLKKYQEHFDLPTTMGLSNISFGLPARDKLNATFLAMCCACGLTTPILNPYDEELKNSLLAVKVLLGQDEFGKNFSQTMRAKISENNQTAAAQEISLSEKITQSIQQGAKEEIADLIKDALAKENKTAAELMEILTNAMNAMGKDFGAGKIFLPEILLAAETMKRASQTIQEILPQSTTNFFGTVVMATVKGDVHDLGKNIVCALLENSGFKVIDLGKDVSSEKIFEAVEKFHADLVGLSALMTTTMTELPKTIQFLENHRCGVNYIVGGAAVTEEYVKEFSDELNMKEIAYAKDAMQAVQFAKKFQKNF